MPSTLAPRTPIADTSVERSREPPALLLALALVAGLAAWRQPATATLPRYDLSSDAATRHDLPSSLREISGLAVSADGRLFAHGDEKAEIHEVDPATGRSRKSFSLGAPDVRGDFEGIAIAGTTLYLTTSTGRLLEFREGRDGESVTYRTIETGLEDRCEIEGLAYDPRTQALLLACKTPQERALRARLTVFAYWPRTRRLDPSPRISLPLQQLTAFGEEAELHPSGIEVHPSGSLYIVAAREKLLVEVRPPVAIAAVRSLGRRHPQTEGITLLSDGTLVLSDEGGSGRAELTTYPSPRPAGAARRSR